MIYPQVDLEHDVWNKVKLKQYGHCRKVIAVIPNISCSERVVESPWTSASVEVFGAL